MCEDFGNEAGGTAGTEIVANYVQNGALEELSIHPSHSDKFTSTMVTNVLRNTPPAAVAQAIATGIGATLPVSEDVVIQNPLTLFFEANSDAPVPPRLPFDAPAGAITLLAKCIVDNETWYYCAVERNNLGLFDYGWIEGSLLPTPTTTLSIVNNFYGVTPFTVLSGLLFFSNQVDE